MSDGLFRSGKAGSVIWTLGGIFGLLIITAVSIVPLSLTILQRPQSDALVIDMAGRQRMLLERHMKEVLLVTQGIDASYERTRETLRAGVLALLYGGTVAVHMDQENGVSFPPAPTDQIRDKLREQQRLLDTLFVQADRLLNTPHTDPSYHTIRDDVLKDNAVLLGVANEVVSLLARHSEYRVRTLLGWEFVVVLLVVSVATVRTWRFVQSEIALQHSQAVTLQALRQSDAVKSALLSSVSHELRTPLTAIKAMLFGIRESQGTQPADAQNERLKSIDEELDYLNRLIGNLLDMSRIEAGMLKPNREWHLTDELVEGAIRRVGQRLARRPLQVELSQDLPPIYVDGLEIQQVLTNLLDNAVKFSSGESSIRIGAAVVGEDIEFTVVNEGEGISSAELDRIFDRFYRVLSGRTSSAPGTGLGLAICKAIVEAHGGSIVARSVPGRETTFSFRLPLVRTVPFHEQSVAVV